MKVFFIHEGISDLRSFIDYIGVEAPSGLEWAPEDPEILFVSEHIYYKSKAFDRFRKMAGTALLKVAFLGEALEPDFNIFDYVVGFSNKYEGNTRYIRILPPLDFYRGFVQDISNPVRTPAEALALLDGKKAFCNFLYSNSKAHPMRDRLFYELSRYKRVDSLGKHLNNVEVPGTGFRGHSAECVGLKSGYKFSIASENASFPGYTSEKLYTSLAAHTVPVYWGNPDVKEDFNPESFLNAGDYASMDALLEKIREIDGNDALWAEMVSAPWRTAEQVRRQEIRAMEYRRAITSILEGKKGKMTAEGYHQDLYRARFFEEDFPLDSKSRKLLRRILG